MEAGGATADDVKTVAVVEVDASAEAVGGDGGAGESNKTTVAARTIAVEASVIRSVVVGPADLGYRGRRGRCGSI
jgi:hypothetical protein